MSSYSLFTCITVLQLTPIERYAMNFLEASLEDVCKEELKQAEVKLISHPSPASP